MSVGLDFLENLGSEPPLFHGAGFEVLDDHIGGFDERLTTSLPASVRRFAVTDCLLRPRLRHQ